MKIIIDAGHHESAAGKRTPDDSMRESHFNSVVADYMQAELQKYDDIEILFTHEKSRDVPLKVRTDMANDWQADLFVSIHANAFGSGEWNEVRGIETFVYTSRTPASVSLANAVQRRLIHMSKLPDRGVKSADFHVLRETRMNAILVECGFMTNIHDAELLKSDDYRKKCAVAIVQGIAENYGLTKVVHDVPLPAVQGRTTVIVNGVELQGYIIEGLAYAPTRATGEGLGATVSFDNETKTAKVEGSHEKTI